MLNNVYRLVAPRVIEPVQMPVPIEQDSVVVRPTHLSICNADMRYYFGSRSPEALAKKLPMALIHEGVGRVVHDAAGQLKPGTHVVMLPNDPVEHSDVIAENYLRSSRFCGSGYDGFMQELCVLPSSRVLELPQGIDLHVAAFTELVSVAVHTVTRFDCIAHKKRDVIGVWGDGNVGFITALVLHMRFPEAQIVVFGRNPFKLADFTFAETYLTSDAANAPEVDHAFECCGEDGSVAAIEQIIDKIHPEGVIALMGVSENPVPVNTRMVLEKGLRIFGSSRSGRVDFEATIDLYRNHPEMLDYLQSLVGAVVPVSSIKDIANAFKTDARKAMGKTIMEWGM